MKIIKASVMGVLAALTLTLIPFCTGIVDAASDVAINEKNFPDKIFREYIKQTFDFNKDNKLSKSEIEDITEIFVENKNIKDLKGIEFFPNLDSLICGNNQIEKLDVSKNKSLYALFCFNNKLTTLDLSKNTSLHRLSCSENKLNKIDVSKNVLLEYFDANNINISTIDLSKNTALEELSLGTNKLTNLDLSKNTKLKRLYIQSNLIKSIDLSKLSDLTEYYGDDNKLSELDLSGNTKLKELWCQDNQLKSLDLSKNKNLKKLYCVGNKMTNLNICGLNKLEYVDFRQSVNINIIMKSGQKMRTMSLLGSSSKDVLQCKNTTVKYDTGYVGEEGVCTAKQAGWAKLTYDGAIIGSVQVLYKDVTNPKDFWYEPTYALMEKGIVKGYDNQTKFKPDNECSRGQMVTFLWRMAGQPAPKAKTSNFTDVKKSDFYYKAVLWAVEKGITTGASKDKFDPSGICTRAQAVTFMWRMADKPEPKSTKNKFSDVKSSDYFYKATLWAAEKKIVAGYSDGTFKPQGKCLRRQMVTFLYKYDKFVNGKG